MGAIMKPAKQVLTTTLGQAGQAALSKGDQLKDRAEGGVAAATGGGLFGSINYSDIKFKESAEHGQIVPGIHDVEGSDLMTGVPVGGSGGCWGPVRMGPMTPAQGEQPMSTVAVRGYQFLGCNTQLKSMSLQLRLPNHYKYAGVAPIKGDFMLTTMDFTLKMIDL